MQYLVFLCFKLPLNKGLPSSSFSFPRYASHSSCNRFRPKSAFYLQNHITWLHIPGSIRAFFYHYHKSACNMIPYRLFCIFNLISTISDEIRMCSCLRGCRYYSEHSNQWQSNGHTYCCTSQKKKNTERGGYHKKQQEIHKQTLTKQFFLPSFVLKKFLRVCLKKKLLNFSKKK